MAERPITPTEATMDDDEKLIAEWEALPSNLTVPDAERALKLAATAFDRLSALKAERDTLKARLESALIEATSGDGVRRYYMDQITALKSAYAMLKAERDHLKDLVGYWKSQGADFGRKFDDLSDAYDAVVIERDRMREALQEAEATFRGYAELHASKSPPAIDKARANDILADRMLAALSQEPTQ